MIRKSGLAISILAMSFLVGCKNHDAAPEATSTAKIDGIIESRDAKDRARDVYRNPRETLAFFELEPEMRVLEVLPGGGWYTRILAPYLAPQGELYAANYADSMWPLFGFFSEERIAERKQSMIDWPKTIAEIGGELKGEGSAFGNIPAAWDESFDHVLLIRALHNLSRFEAEAQTLSNAIADIYRVLKPGGKVGVVQHKAPEYASDEWATGKNGYLKKSAVIDLFQKNGFKLKSESAINNNILDNPVEEDNVWRLAPSLRGHDDDASKQKAAAIGESDRMTLLFVKSS